MKLHDTLPLGPAAGATAGLAEVVFMGQAWAEAYLPRPGDAVVSITDPGAPEASLNDGWAAVLRVAFDDVDPAEAPLDAGAVAIGAGVAGQIARFVQAHRHHVHTLVVHCKHGQSRSAGVAKAVAEAYALYFPANYRYANRYVYDAVRRALQPEGQA